MTDRPLYILPFKAVLWAGACVFLLGLVGSLLGSWFTVRRMLRTTPSGERVIERVERVTVAAEDALASAAAAVSAHTGVILDERGRVVGNTVVLTEDGVFVGSGPSPKGVLRVRGPSGEAVPASVVRTYPEFGVFFLKSSGTYSVPNVEHSVPLLPGTALAAVARTGDGTPRVRITSIESEQFLGGGVRGYQGLARVPFLSSPLPPSFRGAPLVGADGRVRGVVAIEGTEIFLLDGMLLDLLLRDYLENTAGTVVEVLSAVLGEWAPESAQEKPTTVFRVREVSEENAFISVDLRPHDEIFEADGKPLTGSAPLLRPFLFVARTQKPSALSVLRGSERLTVQVMPRVP